MQVRDRARSAAGRQRGALWLMRHYDVPNRYVLDVLREHTDVRPLVWQETPPPEWELTAARRAPRRGRKRGERRYGREIPLRRARDGREYPLTVTVVSPRLLWALLRAPEDVLIVLELNLSALFAVLSKLRGRRKVIVLIEGDFNLLGATGRAQFKVAFRRLVARFVDIFVANSSAASTYLTNALIVPQHKIIEGWWLAGLPSQARHAPAPVPTVDATGPAFLAAGQLIRRKGFDLLIEAVARYRREVGPCRLRIVGEGPEREALEEQARRLGVADAIHFVGGVAHDRMGALLRGCDLFVFPTLHDLVGRVVVEALSVGTPVAVSCHSGAAGILVHDGENGVVMDPLDPESILEALRRGTDPSYSAHLRDGARRSSAALTPEAAAEVLMDAMSRARDSLAVPAG